MEDKNHEFLQKLVKHECRDATYRPAFNPLVFHRGVGSLVYDVEGTEYVDLCAGFGALALGHNHPRIQDVLGNPQQLMHAMGDVYPSADKIDFLSAISEALPSHLSKIAFALSGSQAVEYALKTAMLATGHSGFICFKSGYHGLDFGALSVTPRRQFQEPFAGWLVPKVVSLDFGCSRSEFVTAANAMCASAHGLAGVIVEPVQGRAGVVQPPDGWLEMLSEESARVGTLLIFDEIFTGWGRIGSLTSSSRIDADIICLGKALGGGMPLSACAARAEIMDAWPANHGEALHTGTFFGHPLACRVGFETFKVMQEQNLIERAVTVGNQWRLELSGRLHAMSGVKDVRGCGLMIGIEFTEKGLAARLMDELRANRIIALPSGEFGQVLSLSPALNIPVDLLTVATHRITEAIMNLSERS